MACILTQGNGVFDAIGSVGTTPVVQVRSGAAARLMVLSATYDGDASNAASIGSGVLAVNMRTPVISWRSPAAIQYGTPLNVAPADAAIALDARHVACIIIAEGLSVPEITRLIDLGVKALINAPLGDPRSTTMLHDAIARIRRG